MGNMWFWRNPETIFGQPGIIIPLALWGLLWKGIALWKAGRNNQSVWYIVLLILNTLGIGEIIYLAFFQRNRNKK